MTEPQVLQALQSAKVHLLLAPWHRYLAWTKVDAFFGPNRTSGPTFAGYFAEPLKWEDLGQESGRSRLLLLDLAHPSPAEAWTWVQSLAEDGKRAGVSALLGEAQGGFTDLWWGDSKLGAKIDSVLSMPAISDTDWAKRTQSLRLLMLALWSVVFDEGPGKNSDFNKKAPKACLQFGVNATAAIFRLGFAMPAWGNGPVASKEAIRALWPAAAKPASAWQLLHQHSDFMRLHTVHETGEVELTVGLNLSAPSQQAPSRLRTFCIDPITSKLLNEPLIAASASTSQTAPAATGPVPEKFKQIMAEAVAKMRELKKTITDRDEVIRELRSGGVGTAPPLPPPDASALLEAFQQRFFEAQFQIRQLQLQVQKAETEGATPQQIEAMRRKILSLTEIEKTWIAKLSQTIQSYKAGKTGSGGNGGQT